MVDIERALRNALNDGKVVIGIKQTRNSIKDGSAKMVVISDNCPYEKEIQGITNEKNVPIYRYKGNGVDLGYACGKPFSISVFAVIDEGGSDILKLVEGST